MAETKTCDVQHLAVSVGCISRLQGAQKLWILSNLSVLLLLFLLEFPDGELLHEDDFQDQSLPV